MIYGQPKGTVGTVTFTTGVTAPAVRTKDGRIYVRSVNAALWLLADVDPAQFVAGE